ncbi:MAG: class I SAM-dependent methyltransferase [Rubrivivax sp.]
MTDIDRSFGREQVDADERRARIRRVFDGVAPRYDLMNDLMSMGIHRLWKRRLAHEVRGIGGRVVDLAGGTGDVARLLLRGDREVTVLDPSEAMMAVGRARPGMAAVRWQVAEAESLPLADASVDLVTLSFGLRNATRVAAALAEVRRVLAPGGLFACLEFSRPARWLAPAYDLYSRWVIPALGAAVAGRPEAYRYLVESIRRFPDQPTLAALMTEAGFERVLWHDLSYGIAAIHLGRVRR